MIIKLLRYIFSLHCILFWSWCYLFGLYCDCNCFCFSLQKKG